MPISASKRQELIERIKRLGILDRDLVESFVRGSGKGGQKVNKTNNCVNLRHVPSGIVVRCHRERERESNRFLARRALCDELEYLNTGIKIIRKSSSKGSASGTRVIMRKDRTAPCDEPRAWEIGIELPRDTNE